VVTVGEEMSRTAQEEVAREMRWRCSAVAAEEEHRSSWERIGVAAEEEASG